MHQSIMKNKHNVRSFGAIYYKAKTVRIILSKSYHIIYMCVWLLRRAPHYDDIQNSTEYTEEEEP